MPKGEEPKKLWTMVDPYFYRDKITMPKMLIHGNNDPYWTTDALNLYWDDLKGEKYVAYIANAGHNLQVRDENGKEIDRLKAVYTLAAFARAQINDKPLPKLSWKHDVIDGKLRLSVDADTAPIGARLWVATASTRDFRNARWNEQKVDLAKTKIVGEVNAPAEGCLAFYAELDYEIDGIKYDLCTQIRIAGQAKKLEK
jgi:PhoPQ-activated pathogenicity-related protein